VLAVFDIDTQGGSAEMNGGALRSADHVTVKLAGSTLHFLDIKLDGAVGLLTVFARESHDGRLQAVYSRASYVENAAVRLNRRSCRSFTATAKSEPASGLSTLKKDQIAERGTRLQGATTEDTGSSRRATPRGMPPRGGPCSAWTGHKHS
jgi:hypothetical protein